MPVDGSEHAKRALELASDLAGRYGAGLTVMHVLTRTGSFIPPSDLETYSRAENVRVTEADLVRQAAEELVDDARSRAGATGLKAVDTVIERGDPAAHIVVHAREHAIDLIVMGRRGLGDLAGLLVGSVSHKVGSLADCPCLTVK